MELLMMQLRVIFGFVAAGMVYWAWCEIFDDNDK